jgi:hypothetical protein
MKFFSIRFLKFNRSQRLNVHQELVYALIGVSNIVAYIQELQQLQVHPILKLTINTSTLSLTTAITEELFWITFDSF